MPAHGRDARLVCEVSLAMDDAHAWKPALRVAASLPGPEGPDLLFQAWAAKPQVSDKTALPKKLLESDAIRKRASPALAAALELGDAKTCEEIHALLQELVAHGDARARLPLFKLRARAGCGRHGAEDCHPCLRQDDLLERALERVAE